MATSSIFHNIVISDPQKVDAFIDAIESSIADPRPKPNVSLNDVLMTENDIIKMHNLRKKNAGAKE